MAWHSQCGGHPSHPGGLQSPAAQIAACDMQAQQQPGRGRVRWLQISAWDLEEEAKTKQQQKRGRAPDCSPSALRVTTGTQRPSPWADLGAMGRRRGRRRKVPLLSPLQRHGEGNSCQPPSPPVLHCDTRCSSFKASCKASWHHQWVTGVGIPLLQSGGAGADVGSTGTHRIRASGRPGHSSLPAPFRGHRGKKLPHRRYRRAPRLPCWRTSFTASKIQVHYLCLT